MNSVECRTLCENKVGIRLGRSRPIIQNSDFYISTWFCVIRHRFLKTILLISEMPNVPESMVD